ncbi:CehA/McbA family metallohydrolase [Candidatus Poribacteria bacterium]
MLLATNPFEAEGKWYKGNLHTHTTNSDGAWSIEKVAAEYKNSGYDFLFVTDHGKVSDISGLSEDGFLVLHGEELGAGKSDIGHSYHLVALNLKEAVSAKDAPDVQGLIDLVRSKGGEMVIAHPYWSGLTINDMMGLEGYLGIEVFNTTCFTSIAKGHSLVHWDDMLARGKQAWGFAVDDTHQHSGEHRPNDICNAWIMAKLPELTEAAVMDAIKTGKFYASNGPSIHNISVEDGTISVSTSEVKWINFVCNVSSGSSVSAMGDGLITEAKYKIRGSEKYIRVECYDKDGGGAWSNPVVLNE